MWKKKTIKLFLFFCCFSAVSVKRQNKCIWLIIHVWRHNHNGAYVYNTGWSCWMLTRRRTRSVDDIFYRQSSTWRSRGAAAAARQDYIEHDRHSNWLFFSKPKKPSSAQQKKLISLTPIGRYNIEKKKMNKIFPAGSGRMTWHQWIFLFSNLSIFFSKRICEE